MPTQNTLKRPMITLFQRTLGKIPTSELVNKTDYDALFDARQQERRSRIAQFCQTHVLPITSKPYPAFADDREKILYCIPPKVGCTTWKRALGLISGRITDEKIQKISKVDSLNKYIYNPSHIVHRVEYLKLVGLRLVKWPLSQMFQDEYFKIIVVRDPFLRLISAYQDKLVTLGEGGRGSEPFDELVRAYLNITDEEVLSFHQLVEYIGGVAIDPLGANDEHFDTFNTLCRPCEVEYDFIGKMETLHQDAEYIFRNMLHTNLSLDYLLDASKGPNTKRAKHTDTTAAALMLYNNTSMQLKQTIQSYLSADSKLFGYESERWLGI